MPLAAVFMLLWTILAYPKFSFGDAYPSSEKIFQVNYYLCPVTRPFTGTVGLAIDVCISSCDFVYFGLFTGRRFCQDFGKSLESGCTDYTATGVVLFLPVHGFASV